MFKTRQWLSHDQAVTSICPSSLLTALEGAAAEDDATAYGSYSAKKFVATLYLLSDVLPILTILA